MDEHRLIDIESKLAHQEKLIDELNQVVTDQQARILVLEDLCRSLTARLRSIGDAARDADAERPPHY